MIRFRCLYCGQIIKASEDMLGRKGKCPRCGHVVRVLRPRKEMPQNNLAKLGKSIAQKMSVATGEFAAKDSIAKSASGASAKFADEAFRGGWIRKLFVPTYNELSLFTMSIALLLLFIASAELRRQFGSMLSEPNFYVYLLTFIFFAGMGLSIYHVFTKREKSIAEKWPMLIFAVIANAVSGLLAGKYMLEHPKTYTLIIFPIWNIINAVLLLIFLRFGVIDEYSITDEDATPGQVIICTIINLVVFVFCHFVFKLYWPITYSICVVYATSFSKAIQQTLCPSVREVTEWEE